MTDPAFAPPGALSKGPSPAFRQGFLGWLRANLFFSTTSSIVTLIVLAALVWVAGFLVEWAVVPTWGAQSLSECRDLLHELGRQGEYSGACWGVIRDRWMQLLFGFYPRSELWRPILAFVLLVPALAPVLFAEAVPRRLKWATVLYPFVMPWLLWGGPLWRPLGVLAGFGVGYLVYHVTGRSSALLRIGASIGLALLWWGLVAPPLAAISSAILPIELAPVPSRSFGGFLLSVTIGIVAIAFSLPLGILLALGRRSELLFIRSLCIGLIELIRGVPLITLLFVASTLLNIFLPPGTEFDIIMRVIIMATVFASAYMAEVIRGGLAAIPKGQYEGADSLGLKYWQVQRLVIMPQALKVSIPGIVSTFIALFKDTTLVSIIGLLDPLGLTVSIRANPEWTGVVWELYGFVALIFWIFTFSMSRYSIYLERKLRHGR